MPELKAPRVLIGIPTTKGARRSVAWTEAFASIQMPLGSSMSRAWVEDTTIADARNQLCERALEIGANYLFFLSDDVIPPPQVILAMLEKISMAYAVENGEESTTDMITGVYWTKGTPSEPYLWEKPGLKGSYKKWKAGEFFPIDLAGCDCLMIDTRVLREVPKPWFSTDWLWDDEPKPSPIATEDFYFFTKARKYGFRLFVDTAIQCLHEDRESGQQFGLTTDMPQVSGIPEFGEEHLHIAELGAGTETPYFGDNCKVVRFDARADVHPDVRCDITHLPEIYHEQFDVVHTRHVLEHFGRKEAPQIVSEWTKLLKVGGKIVIRVPNIEHALKTLMDDNASAYDRQYAFAQVYGGQSYPLDYHKNGFTNRKLLGLAKVVPGLTDAVVEYENDELNLKLTATLAFKPKYESIGEWWREIEARQRPELPDVYYDDPRIEVLDAPRADTSEAPQATPAKEEPTKAKKSKKPTKPTRPTGAWDHLPKNGTR